MSRYDDFERDLAELINKHSLENGSDTPDYILARFLVDCLDAWEYSTDTRTKWFRDTASPTPAPELPPESPTTS